MANNHLTLDKIGVQHDTMQAAVIAKSSDRVFDSLIEAANYITWCIQKAMKNLKVELHANMRPEIVETILNAKKIEIQQYKSNEHSGIYIYCDTELQYFISDIIVPKKNKFVIFHKPKFIIRTNVT